MVFRSLLNWFLHWIGLNKSVKQNSNFDIFQEEKRALEVTIIRRCVYLYNAITFTRCNLFAIKQLCMEVIFYNLSLVIYFVKQHRANALPRMSVCACVHLSYGKMKTFALKNNIWRKIGSYVCLEWILGFLSITLQWLSFNDAFCPIVQTKLHYNHHLLYLFFFSYNKT